MLEVSIKHALECLSNNEIDSLNINEADLEAWIDEAGEGFKASLRRQLTRKTEAPRLRMSNIGRPTCQLQMAMSGEKEVRKPYNFIVRMIHGDVIESVLEVLLKIAKTNITAMKSKGEITVSNSLIKGEDDLHIDDRVWDIKSCSPWAFINKWSKGYAALKEGDSFGYLGQLYGYSEAQGKEPGGWVVVDKSSGEIAVVEAEMDAAEKARLEAKIAATVKAIESDLPFKRCFEPIDDKFGKNLTGLKRLGTECGFCDYVNKCWPDAEFKPHPNSKAAKPPHYWFVE